MFAASNYTIDWDLHVLLSLLMKLTISQSLTLSRQFYQHTADQRIIVQDAFCYFLVAFEHN